MTRPLVGSDRGPRPGLSFDGAGCGQRRREAPDAPGRARSVARDRVLRDKQARAIGAEVSRVVDEAQQAQCWLSREERSRRGRRALLLFV
jgi:hypothetical protein